MGSTFHHLFPRYSGTLTHTAPTAIRLWETLTFTMMIVLVNPFRGLSLPRNSVVRLTDCPDMIIAVYYGHKAATQ